MMCIVLLCYTYLRIIEHLLEGILYPRFPHLVPDRLCVAKVFPLCILTLIREVLVYRVAA